MRKRDRLWASANSIGDFLECPLGQAQHHALLQFDRSAVQAGVEQYAKAGAHRFVIGVPSQLKPDQYEAELTRLASLYI